MQSRQIELEKLRLQLQSENTKKLTQLEQQLKNQYFETQDQLLVSDTLCTIERFDERKTIVPSQQMI